MPTAHPNAVDPGNIDPYDRDPGDLDPTEVTPRVIDKWHPSQKPATLPTSETSTPTQTGKQYLETIRAMSTRKPADSRAKPVIPRTAWRDTPEPFRKLVARAAGLPADVVGKLDRDLTESEKALIRAAAKRLMDRASALFAL